MREKGTKLLMSGHRGGRRGRPRIEVDPAAADTGLFDMPGDPPPRMFAGLKVVAGQFERSPLSQPGKPVFFKGQLVLTLEDGSVVYGCADCPDVMGPRKVVMAHRMAVHHKERRGKERVSAAGWAEQSREEDPAQQDEPQDPVPVEPVEAAVEAVEAVEVADPPAAGVGLPAGMTLVDGIPVPVVVGDQRVEAAGRAGPEGSVHYGRTVLTLTNGNRRQGCVDCPTTHTHWIKMAKHREDKHGAPRATRKPVGTGGGDYVTAAAARSASVWDVPALALPSGDGVHVGEVVPDAPRSGPMTLPDGMGTMTLHDLFTYIRQVGLWERALEQEREKTRRAQQEVEKWRNRALADERRLAHIEKTFGRLGYKKDEE